jgi:hypothetical protein
VKRSNINKKELIARKIKYRHEQNLFLNNMNDRDLRRFNKIEPKPDVTGLSRGDRRSGNYLDLVENNYIKKENVDVDIVICIPSHDRYEKLKRIIEQIKDSNSKYSYLIVILNDGSSDERYNTLVNEYPNIIQIVNSVPNGKALHWFCYNQMWNVLKGCICHAVLQMDDDFILCDNFLDIIVDLFFEKKNVNSRIMAISPHLWSFKKACKYESWWNRNDLIDGIALIDYDVIKYLNFELQPVNAKDVIKPGVQVRAWTQISMGIKMYRGIIFRTSESLVFHDGNEDSKLHGDFRKVKKIYTHNFINKNIEYD